MLHCCPDEEDGSKWSKPLLREMIQDGLCVALVYEGAHGDDDAVYTSRKSGLWIEVVFTGADAHGSRPEEGANALHALAEFGNQVLALADPSQGTTIALTRAVSGSTINTAPGQAVLTLDCRTVTSAEQRRMVEALAEINYTTVGVSHELVVLHRFDPMPESMSLPVYRNLRQAALRASVRIPAATSGNGISDASHLTSLGVHTVDGLGPRGGGDHSPAEWIDIRSFDERTELTAAAIRYMRREYEGPAVMRVSAK